MTRARVASTWALAVVTAMAAAACDNRQAFHPLEPGLERMLQQRRGDPYGASEFFRDGRVMRTPPKGAVSIESSAAFGALVSTGRDGDRDASRIPIAVTRALLDEGHETFDRTCAVCHGVLGDGNSVVATKMELRKPPSLHEPRIRALAPGRVFQVISSGYGFMPSYAGMLGVRRRWSVIAYLDALRLSQAAPVAALSPEMRRELAKEAP